MRNINNLSKLELIKTINFLFPVISKWTLSDNDLFVKWSTSDYFISVLLNVSESVICNITF